MKNQKKKPPLKSKPAAKKKAVTLDDLHAQLNAIRKHIAYCVVRLAPDEEKSHPIVKEASECVDL